jgi:NADPH:quinone reductase-like Zn-dependent oxidoreductase
MRLQQILKHSSGNSTRLHRTFTMKAALINKWGDTPKYVDTENPPLPAPDAEEVQVKVIAAGLHRLVRGRATGQHFSANILPHILGSDGVGRTPDGKLVYFSTFFQKGSFCEFVNIKKRELIPIPDNADPVRVAGMVNPLLASWMSIKARTFNLPENYTCLVLGATSTSGKLALSVAKHLGAGKVFGAARNAKAIESAGFDGAIELKDPLDKTDFGLVENVDLILDFIYGPATVEMFKGLKPMTPVQYVQIGTLSQPTMDFPGELLRAKDITLRGAAPGAYSGAAMAAELPNIIAAVPSLDGGDFKVVPLEDIETAWADMKNRYIIKVS